MSATLPGRTFGIGLITTRVLDDARFQGLTETRFAVINLVAALIGGACCLPAGWLMDRFGARRVLACVLFALGGAVLAMAHAQTIAELAISLTVTRALGQSMLSVLALAMIGKWFGRGAGLSMGAYAVVMTICLSAVVGGVSETLETTNRWRLAWSGLGWGLLVITPVIVAMALRARSGAPDSGAVTSSAPQQSQSELARQATLGQALRTRCFWAFALAMGMFALAHSGISLFMQSILHQRGIPEQVYHTTVLVGLVTGLLANLLVGGLIARWPMNRLLALAMTLFAGALAALAVLDQPWHAYLQAAAIGLSGGAITVLFFAIWVRAFGSRWLGRIQGAAQLLSVIGSSAGPLVIAQGRVLAGGDEPILIGLAVIALGLGLFASLTTVPAAAIDSTDSL